MRRWGYAVDIFGASFACSNGRSYAEELPAWYGGTMRSFCLLSYRNTTQPETFRVAVAMAREREERRGFQYSGCDRHRHASVTHFCHHITETLRALHSLHLRRFPSSAFTRYIVTRWDFVFDSWDNKVPVHATHPLKC